MSDNTLPEQRIKYEVRAGGRGAWHVVEYETYPSASQPGQWTRRAAHRRALCGGLSAMVIGIDAEDWPTEREAPVDLSKVTCARCIRSARRIFPNEEVGQ